MKLFPFFFILLCAQTLPLFGQLCDDPKSVFELATNQTYFCESNEPVIIDNKCDENNPLSCIANMVLDWGDGTTITLNANDFGNKQHVYFYPDSIACLLPTNGRVFTISLTLNFLNGRTNKATHEVYVIPLPRAYCSANPNAICLNPTANVSFNGAQSCHEMTYLWDFGEPSSGAANTSTAAAPTHTYSTLGNHLVRLIVTNDCGADTCYTSVQATQAVAPAATFSPSEVCLPAVVHFQNNSQNAISYEWTIIGPNGGFMFVNNTTKLSANPDVIFTVQGSYLVRLKATGACDNKTITVGTVTVRDIPTITMSGDTAGCLPSFQPHFTATLANAGNSTNLMYFWEFPGGSPSTATTMTPNAPTVTYSAVGSYTVRLIAENECGRDTTYWPVSVADVAQAAATFSPAPPGNCGPYTIQFTNNSTGAGGVYKWTVTPAAGWAFVDSTSANSINPHILFSTAGMYTVTLNLPNAICGGTTTWSQSFSVKTPPGATFAPIPDDCAPKTVVPSGFAFNNGGDPAATHTWTATGSSLPTSTQISPVPSFPFDMAGSFAIVFTSSNACGDTTVVDSFTLMSTTPIVFAAFPDTICKSSAPIAVSPNPAQGWSIGGNLFNASNEFLPQNAVPGWNHFEHYVGTGNCRVTKRDSIYVISLTVDAGSAQTVCDTLDCVTFSGMPASGGVWSSSSGNIDPVTGEICTAVAGYGQHTIWHTLTENVLGCVFRDSTTLSINPKPVSMPAGPAVGCTNDSTLFTNNSTGFDSWEWRFGGLGTPGSPDSSHIFTSAGTYSVYLLVKNAWCSDTNSIQIKIVEPPVMALALSDTAICPQEGVLFQNLSTGDNISGFHWDFGNGQVFDGFEPVLPQFFAPGIEDTTYTITLTASGACPNSYVTEKLLVHPLPHLRLTPSLDNTCSGDTLQFSLGTTGGSIFNIVFKALDTITQGLPLPDLTFLTPNDSTNLVVIAIASGENQCGATSDTAIVTIVPNEARAFCDLSTPLICAGDTLFITNGATPLGAQVFYDFGDGTTSTDPNPKKVYSMPGVFKIRQTARSICGYHFIDRFIRVNPAPPVGFAHDAYKCAGDSMHFWLTVEAAGRTVNWDFGAGNTSTAFSPSAVFQSGALFPVTLTITLDSSGCDATLTKLVEIKPNPTANFAASDTIACGELHSTLTVVPGGGQFYAWTASDGNTATGNPANFIFRDSGSYDVQLVVSDIWGCHDDTTRRIFHVLPEPEGDFSMDKAWVCGFPATVQLTETASADALDFKWKFPDGSTSAFNNPSKTFNQPGEYLIQLIVSNIYSCKDTTEKTFRVFAQPIADWGINDPSPCQFEYLALENLSENANRWLWTFNNLDTSTSHTPHYAFQQAGIFDISLVAMLDSFCFDTLKRIGIADIKPAPTAGFYVVDSMPNGYPEGRFFVFSTAVGAETWFYDFGNGQTSSLENPTVHYGQNIYYSILQIVANEWGCMDTARLDTIPSKFGGLFVPNAFVPDVAGGDYTFFMPKGKGLSRYRVRVFSPSGKLVFESQELIQGSPGQAWDGNDFNGKPCAQGAYAWIIEAEYETEASRADSLGATAKQVVETGSVLLIR